MTMIYLPVQVYQIVTFHPRYNVSWSRASNLVFWATRSEIGRSNRSETCLAGGHIARRLNLVAALAMRAPGKGDFAIVGAGSTFGVPGFIICIPYTIALHHKDVPEPLNK